MSIVPTPMANRDDSSEGRGCEKSPTNIESLPDELVFEILLRLPAEDIYDNAKLVRRRWNHMIRPHDFVLAHRLHHSTTGLLVHDYNWQKTKNNPLVYVAMRQGRIEVSEFDYKMRGNNFASCNGLILGYNFSGRATQITNPAIKHQFDVTPFIPERIYNRCFSIAYSPVSIKYKLVHTYYDVDDDHILRCAIATVGVDMSWRNVCTQHLSHVAKAHLYSNNPIVTEGYMHWTQNGTRTLVVSLNVETETFTQYPVPRAEVNGKRYYSSTGKSLSLFIFGSYFSMEVWDMKPETGEWTEMYNIDLERRKYEFERFRSKENSFAFELIPAGWLRYQEVLVLRFSHRTPVCIAYNVLTQGFEFFELGFDSYSLKFKLHTKSLEWLA